MPHKELFAPFGNTLEKVIEKGIYPMRNIKNINKSCGIKKIGVLITCFFIICSFTNVIEAEASNFEYGCCDDRLERKDIITIFSEEGFMERMEITADLHETQEIMPRSSLQFEVVSLLDNGPVFGNFNIAILGDGFTAEEQDLFLYQANLVMDMCKS